MAAEELPLRVDERLAAANSSADKRAVFMLAEISPQPRRSRMRSTTSPDA